MIQVSLRRWRVVGAAATLGLAAACGSGDNPATTADSGEVDTQASVPDAAPAGEGGEAGEAGTASAYAGLAGDQLTALRLQHLKGFLLAADRVAEAGQAPEAGVLVQQGLLEVYDIAPDQFGSLNVDIVRAAGDGAPAHIAAAEAELERVMGGLTVEHAALAARMVDIATGLYQGVIQADFVDPIEYQHSMGAALAARSMLREGEGELGRENASAYRQASQEMTRFVGLWSQVSAPEQPTPYRDVLAQGSRVRLALSPYL